MSERQPPTEQELEKRAREIAERASMTLGAEVQTQRNIKESNWGSPTSQFMGMLSTGATPGFSRRDFALGFVGFTTIGLLITLLAGGERFFLRLLIPASLLFGVAFLFAGRWSFTVGAAISLVLVGLVVFKP